MLTFNEFATQLERAAIRAKNEIDIPTEEVMVAAQTVAKQVIGSYAFGWVQLAPSTQEDRVKHGYSANNPLLRTGEMRDSIEHKTELTPYGAEGCVGSKDLVALWQECGTVDKNEEQHIPPRPFLAGALMRSGPLIDVTFGTFAMKLLRLER